MRPKFILAIFSLIVTAMLLSGCATDKKAEGSEGQAQAQVGGTGTSDSPVQPPAAPQENAREPAPSLPPAQNENTDEPASPTPAFPVGQQSNPTNPYSGEQKVGIEDLVGEWKAYSKAIYDETGIGNYLKDLPSEKFTLSADGKWAYGGASGSWSVGEVQAGDWESWGIVDYGPRKKLVLEGWNNARAGGPVELNEGKPEFVWVIYDAAPPEVEKPSQVQVKFGRP